MLTVIYGKGPDMKKYRTIIITVIATLVIVFVVGKLIKGGRSGSQAATEVRLEEAQRGELIEFVSAPGQIEPKTKVSISAKVSARVIELPYKEGDIVTRGDPESAPPVPASVLVRLDAKDLESQLQSTEAGQLAVAAQLEVEKARVASQQSSLEGLEASLKQARQDLKRTKELFDSKDVSEATFDAAQCTFDELNSQYAAAKHTLEAVKLNIVVLGHNQEAAEARVSQAREALTYTEITSPIDGMVTQINAEVGELVITGTMNNPGTVIMTVADLSQMLVVAQVDEVDVSKVKPGQQVRVRVQAFEDRQFEGVVDSVALTHSVSSSGTKYYKTEILLASDVNELHSGLTADVDIETKKHSDVIKVPSQAVLGRPVDDLPLEIRENCAEVDTAKTYAMVVYRFIDGKAVVTPVKTGPVDMTHIIITSGLDEGDKVVVGPYKVLDGLKHDQKICDERESKEDKDANDSNEAEPNESKNDSKK